MESAPLVVSLSTAYVTGVPTGVDFLCDTPAAVLREEMEFTLCMGLGNVLLHGRRMDLPRISKHPQDGTPRRMD